MAKNPLAGKGGRKVRKGPVGKPLRRKGNSGTPAEELPAHEPERQNNRAFVRNLTRHPALAMIENTKAQAWATLRERRGRKGEPLLKDTNELRELVTDYLTFLNDNPLITARPTGDGDAFHTATRPPATITGLCSFGGFTTQTWHRWRNETADEYREDLAPVMEAVTELFRAATIGQAATGELHSMFVARLLNIGDKADIKIKTDMQAAQAALETKAKEMLGLIEPEENEDGG